MEQGSFINEARSAFISIKKSPDFSELLFGWRFSAQPRGLEPVSAEPR
jgi:hypothetical protein